MLQSLMTQLPSRIRGLLAAILAGGTFHDPFESRAEGLF